MVRPVSFAPVDGIRREPPESRFTGFPNLASLQHRDAFFSGQSYRAQLTRFLGQPRPASPLMMTYGAASNTPPLFGRLLPAPSRHVVLVSPVANPETTTPPAKTLPNRFRIPQGKNPFAATGRFGTVSTLSGGIVEPGRHLAARFAQSRPQGKAFATPPVRMAGATGASHYTVQQLSGWPIPTTDHLALDRLMSSAGRDTRAPHWVHRQPDGSYSLIRTERPQQQGYVLQEHPIRARISGIAAQILSKVFGLKHIGENRLLLPNQAVWHYAAPGWRGPDGRPAELFQVAKLPNGTWMRLQDTPSEQLLSRAHVRAAVERLISRLQESGKHLLDSASPLAQPV